MRIRFGGLIHPNNKNNPQDATWATGRRHAAAPTAGKRVDAADRAPAWVPPTVPRAPNRKDVNAAHIRPSCVKRPF